MRFSSLLIILALLPVASFQSNSPQSPVEISGERHHHAKFENEFVRVWDVTVPAGEATLWHIHRQDNVAISLGDVNLRIETLGRDPVESPWKFGEARFSKATYVHRAMNIGTTDFHNFTIELLKPTGVLSDASKPPVEPGREPLLENERVRIYRLSLGPGQSSGMHTHLLPGLSVMITVGAIVVTTEGKATPESIEVLKPDVLWRAGAVRHSVRNIGTSRFEAVDIEVK
jgi:quercetin dioxygenase-like cupin family protein